MIEVGFLDNILIHIGYHKTASTWLQKELFVGTNDVFEPLIGYKDSVAKSFFVGIDGYVLSPFELNADETKKEVLKSLGNKEVKKDKIAVISHERLSGHPHNSGIDSSLIAKRIKYSFPNARILVIIREQKSFVLSIFYQYLKKGGIHSLKNYLNTKFDRKIPFFSPNHINYLLLIEEYYGYFGKQNVLVLPYEMFCADPKKFVSNIGQFIDRHIIIEEERFRNFENQSNHNYVAYHFRWLNWFLFRNSLNGYSVFANRFFYRIAKALRHLLIKMTPSKWNIKIRTKHANYIDKWVAERYVDSNKKLSQLIDLDLSRYGYY